MPLPLIGDPHGDVDASGMIAVIGVSCRVPGAPGPDELWQLLVEGRHALDGPSPQRAGLLPGKEPGHGGFLPDVAGFDADFFSMPPGEAAVTDPQQRLVLELAWEALEDAGTVPDTLRGTRTGVWVGAMADDYALLAGRAGGAAATPHTLTGLQRALMANRVSYLFGTRGPSLTVDCGQSSSLVAVHLACQSLLHGESDLAVAAGVQLNLVPESTGRVDAFGALSPDGRCRTFDARANGYVRGEGGGVVVLKPLARALADGDPVRAVILGSATNNDGGGPHLSTPDAEAQQEVIRSAWEAAGVDASQAGYVELHGTGTPAGDAVEASALGAVLGAVRPQGSPLPVGSVKTNIGHLEGGAGIAGLLKTVLSVQHGVIPPSLHFREPPPSIPLDALNLGVQQEAAPWSGRRLAGVSSFGVGGSNCHVVLADAGASTERCPRSPAPRPPTTRPHGGPATGPWLVHGRGEAALAAQAARLAAHVRAHPDLEPADVGFSLATTRSVFEHRAAVTAPDREGLLAGLDALAVGELAADVVTGHAPRPRAVAFVFPGQGAQWPLMARQLLQEQPAFAATVADCARELDALTGWSLLDVLNGAPGAPSPDRVDVIQPVLFAVMVALAALWQHHGVEPAAVVGHSQGEAAAAHVAGALSLADAARIVAVRSRLIHRELSGHGGMASVLLDRDAVADRLRPWAGHLTRAAVNSSEATVITGDTAALDEACTALERSGVQVRRIAVDYASHSPAVEALRDPLYAALADIRPTRARVPFYSSLAGGPIDTTELDAGYWYRNLRHEVRFADAVGAQLADGLETFVEVSPHPVLLSAVRRTATAADVHVTLIETLTRGEGGTARFHAALAAAHVGGARVRWPSVWRGTGARPVPLPGYAFQRRPHWLEDTATAGRPATDAAPYPARAAAALARRLSGTLPAERRRVATEFVATVAGALLGLPGPTAVDVDRPLRELGLNSLLTLRMAERLSTASGLPVSPKTLFDHPTCSALADHLAERVDVRPSAQGGADVPDPVPVGVGPVGGDDDGEDHDGPARTITHRDEAPGSAGEKAPRPTAARHDGADEPIAVVGLACRFPGADGPEAFWRLLEAGDDAVRPVPARRWSPAAGDRDTPSAAERAGLLDQDIEGFDAHFFGISPPEAAEMDPQQRLMLEVAWEALEDAGYDDHTLRGTKTGVFIGVTWNDFADRARTAAVSPYTATGKALSMVANRLSYTFGLRGPSLAVDTACSSSLLAVHLACQSLRTGESAVAIAGGVNLLLAEGTFRTLEEFGGLSPDGRCKTFDASADGYARGEGCGAVILKPLSAALADGDDIWCTVKGSAVNNDGQSNGLTAPNPVAQEEVLRDACLRAGVAPADVRYVETHGTGTSLGDHIETAALGAVLGKGRPDDAPLLLGAVKTNIGHLEAAAGVAGLIKTALVLKHRTVPANLHCRTPNPDIDFTALRLPRDGESLPAHGPVLAGVSSFGWGGTNVHVVLESHGGTASGRRRPTSAGQGAVLLFSPPGGDWAGTGRRLYRTRPVFREAVDRCDREFAQHTGRSLSRSLHRDPVPGPEAAFAVHIGTAALLEEAGVRPAAVVGAGTGEIVACVVAGVLGLADGVRLFHELVRTGRRTGRDEAQAVAEAAEHDVARMLPAGGPVRVAAGLGTRTTLLTGPAAELRTLVGAWAADGIRCALLGDADGAPLLLPRQQADPPVAEARCGAGRLPVLSALTGTELVGAELGEGHFVRAAQAPARLADAVSRLLADGHRLIFDMGCHSAATAAVRQTADDSGGGTLVLPAAAWCGPDRAALLGPLLGARPAPAPGPRPDSLFTLTAKSPEALRELAGRVATAIDAEPAPVDVRDVAAAAARRSGQPHRLAVAVTSPDALVDVLRAYAAHGTAPGLAISARPAHRRPKIAFLFPDPLKSAADPGAVRELLAGEPVFRAHAEACDRDFTALLGRSVLTELTGSTAGGTGDRALSTPALFTLQYAMTELLRSWGVEPEVFHGQGAGRFAALHASGGLPPGEAMRRAAVHRPASGDGDASHRPVSGPIAAPGTAGTPCDGTPAGPDETVQAADRWPDEDADAVLEVRLPPLLRLRSGPGGDAADPILPEGDAPVSSARHHLLSVLARLFALGVPVRPQEPATTRWKLPHYPWQRRRFPLPGSPRPVLPQAHRAQDRPGPLAADAVPAVGAPGPQAVTGTGRPGPRVPPATPRGPGTAEGIVETLRLTVAEVVGIPHEAVGDDQPLRDLGMTSVMGVELCNRWEAVLGLRLPDTAVWNYPTVGALAALIERRLRSASHTDASDTGAPRPARPARAPGASSGDGPGEPHGGHVPASSAPGTAPAGAPDRDEASHIARLEAELERELAALARQTVKENLT